jgi:hypothetical protein
MITTTCWILWIPLKVVGVLEGVEGFAQAARQTRSERASVRKFRVMQ